MLIGIFRDALLFNYQGTLFQPELKQRRRRDLNPRAAINDLHPFQGCLFNHLSTSPMLESISLMKLIRIPFFRKDPSGESGIRTHAPFRTNGFQDRLVMTASISLQKQIISKLPLHSGNDYSSKRLRQSQTFFYKFP